VNQAVPSLEVSDSTLGDVENVMRRIRDMTIQGANDTLNANDRAGLVNELDGLKQQLVKLANAKTGDRFIFGGYKDNAPPYDGRRRVHRRPPPPSRSKWRATSCCRWASRATASSVPANGGTDIFQTITDLQTALTSGVADDISGHARTRSTCRSSKCAWRAASSAKHLNAATSRSAWRSASKTRRNQRALQVGGDRLGGRIFGADARTKRAQRGDRDRRTTPAAQFGGTSEIMHGTGSP